MSQTNNAMRKSKSITIKEDANVIPDVYSNFNEEDNDQEPKLPQDIHMPEIALRTLKSISSFREVMNDKPVAPQQRLLERVRSQSSVKIAKEAAPSIEITVSSTIPEPTRSENNSSNKPIWQQPLLIVQYLLQWIKYILTRVEVSSIFLLIFIGVSSALVSFVLDFTIGKLVAGMLKNAIFNLFISTHNY